MDAHDEDLLVVGAVEDGDAAAGGKVLRGTPEEVVETFFGVRRLERMDVHALRVDAGHDMLDGSVLSRGIEGLQDDEHRALGICPKQVLRGGERGLVLEESLAPLRLVVESLAVARIVIGQADRLSGRGGERPVVELVAGLVGMGHGCSWLSRDGPGPPSKHAGP